MIYKCGQCEHEQARGFLPTTSNGLWLVVPAGVAFAAELTILKSWLPAGLGWWWLIALPTAIIAALIAATLLLFALGGIEQLLYYRRPCPQCGARSWSRGYTRGFGA